MSGPVSRTTPPGRDLISAAFKNGDVVNCILGFFRTTNYLTPGSPKWPKRLINVAEQRLYHYDGTIFLEAKSDLAHVFAYACCSRAARAAAFSDVVWIPHFRTMDCQFASQHIPANPDQHISPTDVPDQYREPRQNMSFDCQSALERYKDVRGLYERVRDEVRTFGDESNWSVDDRQTLKNSAAWAAAQLPPMRQVYRARNDHLAMDEIDDAKRLCKPKEVADCAIEMFVLRDYAKHGFNGIASDLVLHGWSRCFANNFRGAAANDFLYALTGLVHLDHFPFPRRAELARAIAERCLERTWLILREYGLG